MTTLWQLPAVVVLIVTWLTAPPTGFADIGRREALRRQFTAASVHSFSNHDLPPVPPEAMAAGEGRPVTVTEEIPEVASASGEVGVTRPPASADAGATVTPAAVEGAPAAAAGEKQWRDRMTNAQQALERDQVLADAMQSRINALNNDVISRDDPAQQADLRRQLQRAVAEQQRLQAQLVADQKAIDAIRLEARRLGVPAGWVR